MDVSTTAQYATIASAVMAFVSFIPTIMSYYRGWGLGIRRTLGALFCVSLGMAVGASVVLKSSGASWFQPPEKSGNNGDTRIELEHTKALLEAERKAREAAEKRVEEAEQQGKNERSVRELADRKVTSLQETVTRLETNVETLNRKLAEKDATSPVPTIADERARTTPLNETANAPPPRQKLEQFVVEVPRAQAHGERATIYVRFTSTVAGRIKLLLADGFLGHNKTFLTDDTGQQYDLDNSSGIGMW